MPILLLLGLITIGRSAMLSEIHVDIYCQQSTAGRYITNMYSPGGVIVRIWSVEICELDWPLPERK